MSFRSSGKEKKKNPTTASKDLKLRKTVGIGMGQGGLGHHYPKAELKREGRD